MARKLFLLDKLIQYFIGKPSVERQLMSQQGKKVKVFFLYHFSAFCSFYGFIGNSIKFSFVTKRPRDNF